MKIDDYVHGKEISIIKYKKFKIRPFLDGWMDVLGIIGILAFSSLVLGLGDFAIGLVLIFMGLIDLVLRGICGKESK